MAKSTGQSEVSVRRFPDESGADRRDVVTTEEPLEILLEDQTLAITMRTPGHDLELVAGFLWTEGVIRRPDQILSMEHCRGDGKENTIRVRLAADARRELPHLERHFYTSSSCGICGKVNIDAVLAMTKPISHVSQFKPEVIHALPDRMSEAQQTFRATGGCHGAAWFDASGRLLCLREDVGRHNAVDKLVGWAILSERLPINDTILLVSGRVSFEIMQKAVMAAIPIVAAVGAPTSLAIEAAQRFNQTLIGFCRDGRFNVYHESNY